MVPWSMAAPMPPFSGPEIPFLDNGSPVVSGKWEIIEEKPHWVWTFASGSQQSANALEVAIDSSLAYGGQGNGSEPSREKDDCLV